MVPIKQLLDYYVLMIENTRKEAQSTKGGGSSRKLQAMGMSIMLAESTIYCLQELEQFRSLKDLPEFLQWQESRKLEVKLPEGELSRPELQEIQGFLRLGIQAEKLVKQIAKPEEEKVFKDFLEFEKKMLKAVTELLSIREASEIVKKTGPQSLN